MPASVCKDLLRLTNVSPSMSNVCFLNQNFLSEVYYQLLSFIKKPTGQELNLNNKSIVPACCRYITGGFVEVVGFEPTQL
ncbi:hypothetical protein [Chryseobacterium indologenes]|uniref:hypothetical protein n=1 Tax=Chryseobacterium indologenes TaxID=253 RepID=UPI00103D51B7|nr:hypothetical protein [Chryseobacterium indologenes]